MTYNQWPLYTFIGDTAAGQAKGQGLNTFGGHWSALDTQGAAADDLGAEVHDRRPPRRRAAMGTDPGEEGRPHRSA